jgi:hypothetical protein
MLKVAIVTHGPAAVGIDASHKSFAFYSDGVYYEPKCGKLSCQTYLLLQRDSLR